MMMCWLIDSSMADLEAKLREGLTCSEMFSVRYGIGKTRVRARRWNASCSEDSRKSYPVPCIHISARIRGSQISHALRVPLSKYSN